MRRCPVVDQSVVLFSLRKSIRTSGGRDKAEKLAVSCRKTKQLLVRKITRVVIILTAADTHGLGFCEENFEER